MIFFKRPSKTSLVFFAVGAFSLSTLCYGGQVVVRTSSEPFDAFAVRDQVLREHQWQEFLRMQQQIHLLRALPTGCLLLVSPYAYYSCHGLFYWPHQYPDRDAYIRVDAIGSRIGQAIK